MMRTSIFDQIIYGDSKPVVTPMMETDHSKEVRIAMRQGQVMKEHKTRFPITVEVFRGKISFGVEGEIYELEAGALISLDGNVPHDLKAQEDSIIRLTLSKLDQIARVEKLVQ